MDSRTRMYNALKPLLTKTIADAEWDKVEWHTPTWEFAITDGNFRFRYWVGSAPNRPGVQPKFQSVIHEGGNGEFVEQAPLVGNLFVNAIFSKDGISEYYSYGDMYNPGSGQSVEDWAKDFVRKVTRFEK